MSDLVYIQKIAENQTGRTTWIAKYKGTKCIAKKIVVDRPEKRAELIKQLNGQVTFSERLSGDDRHRIILFNQMVEDRGAVVFLRDFVDGVSLENLISDRMEWKKAIKWMQNIASIVQRSHGTYHVLHGDLKLANILVRKEDKSLCIIDWDTMRISKQIISGPGSPTISEILGTPEYMSPEQCAGKNCDFQTDIYALGVILYRLLTDTVPFEGMSAMQILTKKQQEPLPPFSSIFPFLDIPHDLGKLIDDALQKDQNKRIRNIDEFIERLDRIIDDSNAPVMPPHPPQVTNSSPNVSTSNSGTTEERPLGKRTKNDLPIVIIGPTQSGKTVLAGGLYRSHSDNFNVSALDEKTRQYADQIGSILKSGNWPAATTKNEVIQLQFKLDIKDWTGTRSGIVEFRDYSGEDMRKDSFCRDFIGQPEVVLFLFNPGTPWIADTYPNKRYNSPSEKNAASYHLSEFISRMKDCVNYIVNLPNQPAIAIVITAADRLESDLKPYREQFEAVVSEICNALTLNKCTWKRFEVSVCKPLARQDELDFNPQHIHQPFVWALNRKRLGRILKRGTYVAAALLGIFLVCWALLAHRSNLDKAMLDRFNKEVVQVDDKFTNTSTSAVQKECVDELREVLENNKALSFRTNQYRKQYEETKTNLKNKIDQGYINYLDLLLKEFQKSGSTEKSIKEIENRITEIQQWQPCIKDNQKEINSRITKLNEQKDILIGQNEGEIERRLTVFDNRLKDIQKSNDGETVSLEKLQKEVEDFSKNTIKGNGKFIGRCNTLLANVQNEIGMRKYQAFLRSIEGNSAKDALVKLNEWLDNNSNNPKRREAQEKVYKIFENDIINYVRKCLDNVNNQSDYEQLRALCELYKGAYVKYPPFKDQKLSNFVIAFLKWYNPENRKYTITVTKLEAKSTYSNGGYIWKINDTKGSLWWYWSSEKLNSKWSNIKVSLGSATKEPWEEYSIKLEHYYDSNPDKLWESKLSIRPKDVTRLKDVTTLHKEYNYTNCNNSFRIEFEVTGRLFKDLVKDNNLPISVKNK